jgi:trehalose 6-phosphate synthase/phosphatase
MALFIISNRLPIKVSKSGNDFIYERSEGGLTTGLASLNDFQDRHWIGWPGIFSDDEQDKKQIESDLSDEKLHPVFLSEDQILNYYEGYSNSMIWPLCHYFYAYIQYETKFWDSYQEVNQLFCDEAVKSIKPGDMVWIQDYQLMLLPAMLRARIEGISIGYFHHIPFPSYELFRVLPERAKILMGLLGADLIGFHTHDYMRHFISAAYRVLGLDCNLDKIHFNDRIVHVDAFPMGINYDLHYNAILDESVQQKAKQFRENFGNHELVLSVDRLDYSKGIIHRLKGFGQFLKNNPEYLGKVSLVMVVVPSRDNVDRYAELKTKIDETIGSLNGLYSTLDWSPVFYFYRGFPFDELMALYHIANFALVTPLRDGMNLVAKEYVAVKRSEPGMLILSEMAGVAAELREAIVINPNNIDEIEEALLTALTMADEEKQIRMEKMRKTLLKQTVNKWAHDFTAELSSITKSNFLLQNKKINADSLKEIQDIYRKSNRRLIVLDYDGTLAPFVKKPELAIPDKRLIETLKLLSADKQNNIVISSGRDSDFLDKWFSELDLNLAAEHGAFFKEHGIWHENVKTEFPEDEEIMDILHKTTDKTPGSRIELKKTSIVWHYRNCDKWLSELRQQQLVNNLMFPCTKLNLQIMRGNKVIEIKTVGVDKGVEAQRLIEADNYDFIMAMGDDITDEDMFRAMPHDAITIKVGSISDHARYSLAQSEVIKFLNSIVAGNN